MAEYINVEKPFLDNSINLGWQVINSCDDLKDLKIIFIVDRTDLEDQHSETAAMTGETVRVIDRRNRLHL